MQYRPEIDGLRTIAVLPVILFHAGLSVFSGGYVGVDVFFVISGYLITGILLRDLEAERFSILTFYERRARRILPALFFVMLCCVPFAYAWMLPEAFKDFHQSLIAVVFFASNILFWRESGYFAAAAEEKPLLHTWSLAVEEQYYLLFPLMLLALWRFGRAPVFWIIAGLAALSLIFSEWGARNAPDANFYLPFSRAWELFAGSLAAFVMLRRPPAPNDLLAGIGLALIVVSILVYDAQTPFPSLYALAPAGGTVLIILFAGPVTWTGRFLSLSPMVGIGLISYSAYLWHQPLFAFARLRSLTAPPEALMLGLAALSLILAWFSWKFIETPFRKGPNRLLPGRGGLFAASALVGAVFVGLGVYGHQTGGPETRAATLTYERVSQAAGPQKHRACQYRVNDGRRLPELPDPRCEFPHTAETHAGQAVLLGDSHAGAIAGVLRETLQGAGYDVTLLTVTACPPFRGYDKVGYGCQVANDRIRAHLADIRPDLMVLAFRPQPLFTKPFDNGEGGHESNVFTRPSFDHAYLGAAPDAGPEALAGAVYRKGVSELAALTDDLVLIYPIPEAGWHVTQSVAKQSLFGFGAQALSTDAALYQRRNGGIIADLDRISTPNLHRIRPGDIFCNTDLPGRCVNAAGGEVFYRDDDHLSATGAARLMPALQDILAGLQP
ncbi:MAG: acyltransferase family protein [Paracoccaceae bacterium]